MILGSAQYASVGKSILTAFGSFDPDINAWVSNRNRGLDDDEVCAAADIMARGDTWRYSRTDPSGEQSTRLDAHAAAGWAAQGYNVFEVTESLAAGLLLTESSEESPDLPYNSFILRVPLGILGTVFDSEITQLLVHRFNSPTQGIALIFETRDEQFYKEVRRWPEGINHLDFDYSCRDELTKPFQAAMHLLRNVCTWLERKSEEPWSGNSRRFAKACERNEAWPHVWVLGRKVKLSKEIRAAAVAVARGDQDPTWRLRSRFIVRGHRRWQPIGARLPDGVEGPVNAKSIWIEPFWKGPVGAQAWSHLYQLA